MHHARTTAPSQKRAVNPQEPLFEAEHRPHEEEPGQPVAGQKNRNREERLHGGLE